MKSDSQDVVFAVMHYFCVYRVADLVRETGLSASSVRHALRRLSRGGVVDVIADKRRRLYQSRQRGIGMADFAHEKEWGRTTA